MPDTILSHFTYLTSINPRNNYEAERGRSPILLGKGLAQSHARGLSPTTSQLLVECVVTSVSICYSAYPRHLFRSSLASATHPN